MGRYANFNTGVEYKFAFGIQPSEDMTTFGGMVNDTDDEQYNSYYAGHLWEDKEEVFCYLVKFDKEFVLPNFEKYEKSMEGTYKMLSDEPFHFNEDKEENKENICRFILGCVIYHQLLYQSNLSVTYEL